MASGIKCIVEEANRANELAESTKDVPESLVQSTARVTKLFGDFRRYVDRMASPSSPEVNHIVTETMAKDWEEFSKIKECTDHHITPRMMTGHEEAQILRMLVSMSKATRVLEIGMFTGCAALAMAEALPSNGTVITCDANPALESLVREFVDRSPHGKKITIKIGPALETMQTLHDKGHQFDFVFIDADKDNYVNYFKFLLDNNLLAPGGTICVDNVLWGGNAFLAPEERNSRAHDVHAIPDFNEVVANDDRVYNVMLTNRDGILLIRRKSDVDVEGGDNLSWKPAKRLNYKATDGNRSPER